MSKLIHLIIAGALVSQALADSPSQQAEALYQKGQAAEKAGDPATAKEAYASALKAYPNHANARYSLGQLRLTSGTIAAKGRETKFGSVMIPEFRLSEATLQESIQALGQLVEKESKEAVTPNFVIEDPKGEIGTAKITLDLKNMPAKAVLKYVLDQAKAKARFDEHAVVILPQ